MNTTFKSTLIVIDDLERLSQGINYNDLLGFISQLKNEKKCKIIIILNDKEIKDDYHKIKEKIVDKDIKFEPTVSELCQIGLVDLDFGKEACENAICDIGCKNIRTIFKIKYFINLLKNNFSKLTKSYADEAIRALCIICYCYWENDGKMPKTSFIKASGDRSKIGKMLAGKAKEQNSPKFDYLRSIDFDNNYRWREVLTIIVENGYLENSNIEETIDKNVITAEQESTLAEWQKTVYQIHNNLELYKIEKEWLDKLLTTSINALGLYSLRDLDWVIRIFRTCRESKKADKIIEAYKNKYIDTYERFIINRNFGEITDDKFRNMLNSENARLNKPIPLIDALTHMATQNSWTPEIHEPPINAATDRELYDIFKNTKGKNLYVITNFCLKADTRGGFNHLAQKSKKALLRIQSEGTKLTKFQIKNYDLDNIK